jgi:hypothetical protein
LIELVTYYTRLLNLWRDADPPLAETPDMIRRRRGALSASSG